MQMINLRNINETLKFDFQQVFNEDSSQEELFGTVVQPVLNHFTDNLQNVSIFAYGPTGSGKFCFFDAMILHRPNSLV